MNILVFSDSHASLRFMRNCIEVIKPDAVIHLGDHYDDGQTMAEAHPHIRFHLLPGNCDRYRCPVNTVPILCYDVFGVRLYMTHGHLHGVKTDISKLLSDARNANACAVLFGHTHSAVCYQEEDGLWVLNPGSCGYGGGSVGIIEVSDNKISTCRLIGQADLLDLHEYH